MAGSDPRRDRLTSQRNGFLGTSRDGRQEASRTARVDHPFNAPPNPRSRQHADSRIGKFTSDAHFLAGIGVSDGD